MPSDMIPEGHWLSGQRLYGDDFTSDQIAQWVNDEQDAYFDYVRRFHGGYRYIYHALNRVHGFRHLPSCDFEHCLSFGGAKADELVPILDRVKRVTVLEPAKEFWRDEIQGKPCRYVAPAIDGSLSFSDNEFDLITCLGVLHHIPNVSHVVSELARCLRPGGYLLVKEPINSMGDWTKPRPKVTIHERGIPLNIFRSILDRHFRVKRATLCAHPITSRLPGDAFNSSAMMVIDRILCFCTKWNLVYHRQTLLQKIAPWALYCVCQKPSVKIRC